MRLFFIFILLFVSLSADYVHWYSSYEKAHEKAIKERKNLLILLIEKNSKSSAKVIQKTFMQQPYIKDINKNFISVIVMKDQKESYPIEMLYTFEYPSLFLLDNTELFICKPIRGDVTPNRLKKYLEQCK
jgi:hypothetical protein